MKGGSFHVNKKAVVSQILAALDAELASYARSARSAHAEATDEQNKAENKYDTRGLEASYLAAGQSKMALECMQAREEIGRIGERRFSEGNAIDLGALVTVRIGSEESNYFVAPRAGGTEVIVEGASVLVITPQSPLGQQLTGKAQGASFGLKLGGSAQMCNVLRVE